MQESSPFAAGLPANHYGVHIENDMDARRLLYLVEKIGAEKVTRSASTYTEKYPGERIFVSALLKRYGVKVPTLVYAPVNVPLYRVYMLLHLPSSSIKIGYSANWTQRALAFECEFDLDRSISFSFHDKACAIAAESNLKRLFDWARTEPPVVPFGAGGHREWFDTAIYHEAFIVIATFETHKTRKPLTLRVARDHDIGRYLGIDNLSHDIAH
ncbi:hypothetical protein [Pseudomonas syringae]|uniref:hypothetical protein n=1 Tax=Pseudomonas syringae TaxID=317 RepID=UPI000F00F17B|nr:hypothetical protein [Pseudomonas syringae]MCF5736422.1 hypothetical protein [Pseudomonas syringae]MCF5742273.1 hypothetical protein [Pseudomonas syringae]MCF5751573.1 hypothetical protein [Pseudomonas syringae]MCF5758147.1 hypothetical protein [Pseudomonas syringae]